MALRDIPAARFPLRVEKYTKLDDEIKEIASRFSQLGYEDLAREFDEVRVRLDQAWQTMRAAESAGL